MDQAAPVALMAAGGCCLCIMVVFVAMGFKSVSPTEMCIQYNWLFKSISPDVITTPGFGWRGFATTLYRYPTTLQSINYSAGNGNMIDGRTSDGLPIKLEVAFQFQLNRWDLHKLYMQYEATQNSYLDVYKLVGTHLITEMATNYSAYKFFDQRAAIASEMGQHMNEFFMTNLYATISTLQINGEDLPREFTEMVNQVAAVKQNIQRANLTLHAEIVNMQTDVNNSKAQAKVIIQNAHANHSTIAFGGQAQAKQIGSYINAETQSYKVISDELKLQGDELLKYIWLDSMGGGNVIKPGSEFSVFAGINPSAYIQES
jgi:hypothetical protein